MWNTSLHSNMNFPAPVAVLAFLTAGGGGILVVLGILIAMFVRKPKFAALLMKLAGVAAVIYFILLLGFSLGSREAVLVPGQEKYFCEIDCHLAYTVLDAKTIPDAGAERYKITVRTRFDEATISSQRPKDYPLSPSPRTVVLTDHQGNRYAPAATAGTPLAASLTPGQSYTTELDFRVPSGAKGLKLLISTTPGWPDQFVIGDENSWLHKKTYFQVEMPGSVQSLNREPAGN